MTFDERYDAKVDRSGGPDACWPWTVGTNKKGYGCFAVGRRGEGMVIAHRVALERKLGRPIKPGYFSLHHCDNPPCNNPAHLFEGTHKDNARDRNGKGRSAVGERNGKAKLTEDNVREIRRRVSEGEMQWVLAEEFSVARPNISDIISRKLWKHVGEV